MKVGVQLTWGHHDRKGDMSRSHDSRDTVQPIVISPRVLAKRIPLVAQAEQPR